MRNIDPSSLSNIQKPLQLTKDEAQIVSNKRCIFVIQASRAYNDLTKKVSAQTAGQVTGSKQSQTWKFSQ